MSRQAQLVRWQLGAIAVLLFLSGCAGNRPPSVEIMQPKDGAFFAERTVAFTGRWHDPDGRVNKLQWAFGDGSVSDQEQPNHTYSRGGEYVVTLTVTDDRKGTDRALLRIRINQEPRAVATARLTAPEQGVALKFVSGDAPLPVDFSSLQSSDPDGRITSLLWEFGDGETSTEATPRHIYGEPGDYDAVLRVTDDHGAVATDSVTIRVQESERSLWSAAGVSYHLWQRSETAAPGGTGRTVLSWYVTLERVPLTVDRVREILSDAARRMQRRTQSQRLVVYLFNQFKANFMAPGDYDHYLGMAVWDEPQERGSQPSILLNDSYFTGRALSVYGYKATPALVAADDPACPICSRYRVERMELYLFAKDETICQVRLLHTLRAAIKDWLGSADGYAVRIYGPDLEKPIAYALGVNRMPLEALPSELLRTGALPWHVQEAQLRLHYGSIPACP